MRALHQQGWDLADELLVAFANMGYWPTPDTKLLDYGCGAGGLVYRFRDLGFDAYGFDIHERVEYRAPDDRRFFGFVENPTADTSDSIIARDRFGVPFPDDSFDVVVSTSVLEHVMDLPPVMAEIARVLKPSGVALHLYPSKSVFIEPHIYVPFGSRLQSRWYFYLWGLLGVRNEYQEAMSAREVADNNVLYSRTGLKYYTRRELRDCCAEHFDEVRFADRQLHARRSWLRFLAAKGRALFRPSPLRALAGTLRISALLTAKKKRANAAGGD